MIVLHASDSAFKQQRLPAWQPILTASTVLPTFFVIGIAFIPVGVVLLHISDQVQEFSYDYTDCKNSNGIQCAQTDKYDEDNCKCIIPFTLNKSFDVCELYFPLTFPHSSLPLKTNEVVMISGRSHDVLWSDEFLSESSTIRQIQG